MQCCACKSSLDSESELEQFNVCLSLKQRLFYSSGQVLQDKAGYTLVGNVFCVYCHTPDITPVLYLQSLDIPAIRHFLTVCDPGPVKYMSLEEVGTFHAII